MKRINSVFLVSCFMFALGLSAKSATPKKEWIKKRVDSAEKRMSETKGGQLLLESIQKHGGLERWYANGPVDFRFNYMPLKGIARDSFQQIDTWQSKARHQSPDKPGLEFGWDGSKAWSMGGKPDVNVRFWSLTPYYFVAMPFVFADDGLSYKYDGEYAFEGKKFDMVRVTYGANVGDSPDDFYVALIDKKTKILAGTRYIVTNKKLFKKGGQSPEKLIMYDGENTVDGIIFPTAARSFAWNKGNVGPLTTRTVVSDVKFRSDLNLAYFDKPAKAVFIK